MKLIWIILIIVLIILGLVLLYSDNKDKLKFEGSWEIHISKGIVDNNNIKYYCYEYSCYWYGLGLGNSAGTIFKFTGKDVNNNTVVYFMKIGGSGSNNANKIYEEFSIHRSKYENRCLGILKNSLTEFHYKLSNDEKKIL